MLDENISIITRSNVLVNAIYQEHRVELLSFLNKTLAEIVVFLREGNNLIGIVCLAKKSMHQDYTIYDINMIQEIYSYFFSYCLLS